MTLKVYVNNLFSYRIVGWRNLSPNWFGTKLSHMVLPKHEYLERVWLLDSQFHAPLHVILFGN
jgi:hypothetical protein